MTDIYYKIKNGDFDMEFDMIYSAIKKRQEVLNNRVLNKLQVGSRVRFNSLVNPKYLIGKTGKITKVYRKRVELVLDNPQGRFGKSPIKCPVSIIEPDTKF